MLIDCKTQHNNAVNLSQIHLSAVSQPGPSLCNPMDYSPPGSSVHGILQARILEWVAIIFSRGPSWPRNQTQVSCNAGRFFTDISGYPWSSAGKESTCNVGDLGSIPGLGRSPGEMNGYSLQCSCLENPMDRGAWETTVQAFEPALISHPSKVMLKILQARLH